MVSGSISLRSRGSFHLSLSVLSLSVVFWYLALDGGPPYFSPDSSCPAILWISLVQLPFRLRDSHAFSSVFPNCSTRVIFALCSSLTPSTRRLTVWALPCSLAATEGISFDYFSSGYLDVSVHRVCLLKSGGTT